MHTLHTCKNKTLAGKTIIIKVSKRKKSYFLIFMENVHKKTTNKTQNVERLPMLKKVRFTFFS